VSAARFLLVATVWASIPAVVLLAPDAGEATAGCKRPGKVVIVNLDNRKHRPVLRHAWDAIRDGHPEVLHIARYEAEENRRASLRGRSDDDPDTDLDEYPPAMADEGGAGASVRAIDSSANRSAGAVMGNRLRPFCNGVRFRYERKPGPKA
jgi:hypothetical protein